MAAELDIPVLINVSKRNIIFHDVLLNSILNSTNINYPIFGFW